MEVKKRGEMGNFLLFLIHHHPLSYSILNLLPILPITFNCMHWINIRQMKVKNKTTGNLLLFLLLHHHQSPTAKLHAPTFPPFPPITVNMKHTVRDQRARGIYKCMANLFSSLYSGRGQGKGLRVKKKMQVTINYTSFGVGHIWRDVFQSLTAEKMNMKVDSKLFKHLGHERMRRERRRKGRKRRWKKKKVKEDESRTGRKIKKGVKGRSRAWRDGK